MKNLLKLLWIPAMVLLQPGSINAQWFGVTRVAEKVWQINDHGTANIYLVEGSDSALIIDTGIGAADLVSTVRKITEKPLIVVNTHGHPDHVGANYQFEKVYIHKADAEAARSFMGDESREQMGNTMAQGATPAEGEKYAGPIHETRLVPVSEGHFFHLGNRMIEVIETPGHTPGGICLLDRENKLLFSGDNNNTLVWLFLDGCLPLSTYLQTLEKQAAMLAGFDTLLPGHGPPIASAFILDQIACVSEILDGSCDPKPYQSFAGDALFCTSGKASVAYNPENL